MRKIFFTTDYNCNNKCVSCAKKVDETGSLSLEQITKTIDFIKPTRKDIIEISGGEPTLRKDLIDICNHIKLNYDTNLIILSNGRRFSDRGFTRTIKSAGVDRVVTAFYSPYEDLHDEITQINGSFKESMEGLKNLEEARVPISIKTIMLKQNYEQLPAFVNFVHDIFPSAWISFHGLMFRGHAEDNKTEVAVEYKTMKPFIESALDIAMEKDKNLGVFLIPSCVIDPFYWNYLSVNGKDMAENLIYVAPGKSVFGKLSNSLPLSPPLYCEGCLVEDNCSWAWEAGWKEYVALFGDKELQKVTKNSVRY